MSEDNGTSEYVVQRYDGSKWLDLETVTVPPRTKRGTILRKALENRAVEPGPHRVLDAESARPMNVTLEDQPPKVVIG